ncbi:MAG TPA: hypothetical protein VK886_21875 [Vicinamibacterales bacterium]|nr:hypothetical protein [Vicinamibacterales bacterium]
MALMLTRKTARRRSSPARSAAQGVLWDPILVGRSFERAALTFRSGEEVLRERLRELELKRRRAQIRARRALEDRDPATSVRSGALPFAS